MGHSGGRDGALSICGCALWGEKPLAHTGMHVRAQQRSVAHASRRGVSLEAVAQADVPVGRGLVVCACQCCVKERERCRYGLLHTSRLSGDRAHARAVAASPTLFGTYYTGAGVVKRVKRTRQRPAMEGKWLRGWCCWEEMRSASVRGWLLNRRVATNDTTGDCGVMCRVHVWSDVTAPNRDARTVRGRFRAARCAESFANAVRKK